MLKEPKRFSPGKIWKESISPQELESWVRFVQEKAFETLKEAGESVLSVDDIHLTVSVEYPTLDYRDSKFKRKISVITTRTGGFTSQFDIACFSRNVDAIKTFEEYAKFKKATKVCEHNDRFETRKEITVA
ncbi:MAG: hypothetical protein J6A89_01230 [Clostridia bacterium]|nr:hypothetical protein [Clostridia bacterium]